MPLAFIFAIWARVAALLALSLLQAAVSSAEWEELAGGLAVGVVLVSRGLCLTGEAWWWEVLAGGLTVGVVSVARGLCLTKEAWW